MSLENKIYQVGNTACKMNLDYTLDDGDFIQKIFAKSEASDNSINLGSVSTEEFKQFLSIIMVPVSGLGKANIGNCKQSVAQDIIKDFFLRIMSIPEELTKNSTSSTKKTSRKRSGAKR